MAQGLYKKIVPVEEIAMIYCSHIQVSEHMWAYFNFSYDPDFKDKTKAVIPNHGEYTLEVSQDGVNFEHWASNIIVSTEGYTRHYRLAGYITHVRAVPTNENIPAMDTPPFPGQLYCRLTIARC